MTTTKLLVVLASVLWFTATASADSDSDASDVSSHEDEHATRYGGHVAVYGTGVIVDYLGDAGLATGFVVGGTMRAAIGGLPSYAWGIDAELGYADGELVGRAQLSGGFGIVRGPAVATLLIGTSAGKLVSTAPFDVSAEISVAAYSPSGTGVWAAGAHAEGHNNIDHDRIELRVFLPSRADLHPYLGARGMWIDGGKPDQVGDAAMYLLTFGLAIVAKH